MGENKNNKISKLFIVLKVNDELRSLLSFLSTLEENGENTFKVLKGKKAQLRNLCVTKEK